MVGNVTVITCSENTAKGNRERWSADYQKALLIRKGYAVEEPVIDDMPVWSDPVPPTYIYAGALPDEPPF